MRSDKGNSSPGGGATPTSTASSTNPKSVLGRLRRMVSPSKRRLEKTTTGLACPPPVHTSSSGAGRELHRVFAYFDEDGDGKITPEELQRCVRSTGGDISGEEAQVAVRSWDKDGDGALGLEDFQGLMDASEEEKTQELRHAFGMYEAEPGSGCITPTSLKRMLSRLGQSTSIADCKAMIRPFDLNGDGVLSFPEFAVMMR
ncbi:hypothetical protein Tsubulata_037368 [Turnera subulata]|uniref:EF-hand domain-containing protein n=1 Tax=Turnera subulata TaxID=218843 RepID=A0A9Q0FSA8_9ROSI|nr:hypothetical protein Tsubulata_037368 [Turnera subulata]